MSKLRAFTLVELVIVCMVLVMFAALVVPKAVRFRQAQVERDAIPSLIRLISYGREQAIAQRTTALMTYDGSTHTFTVKQDTTLDANTPTTSANSTTQGGATTLPPTNTGRTINLPVVPTIDQNNPTINKTETLPTNVTTGGFQVAGKDVAESDFQLRFYSDGTCDSGGIALTIGTDSESLNIDNFGRVTLINGPLPDPNSLKWEAGSFEPRQQ